MSTLSYVTVQPPDTVNPTGFPIESGVAVEAVIVLNGRGFRGIAYDSGFLWALHLAEGGIGGTLRISKINPETGEVVQESSDLSWNGRGITVGDGSLWVSDAETDVIHRVDPSNFNVISSFNTPGSEPNGLAFDGSNLWLTDPWFQKIYELNTSGGVVSSFGIPNAFRHGLEWENSGMWTNTAETEFSHYLTDGTIDKVGVLAGLPSGTFAYDIAIGNGTVYVSGGDTIYIDELTPVPAAAPLRPVVHITPQPLKAEPQPIPHPTRAFQNYPNPFNPETWIPYQLADDAPVTLKIYNLNGWLIHTLALGVQKAGVYLTRDKAAYWDGRDDAGERVSSGVYFYTLRAGEFVQTRKMLVVK